MGKRVAVLARSSIRNTLLAHLDRSDFALLSDHIERAECPRGFVIAEPDRDVSHVYFLDTGVGSIIATSPEGQKAEAGLFGRDGFSPVPVFLGSDRSPNLIVMQIGGAGVCIGREAFVAATSESATLRGLLMLYVQALNVQASFTALSNAVHQVDERLARWLLMCHDRVDSDDLPITHEFLAIMLAVRRPSVTTSLHALEGNGFIRAERGVVTIRNRAGLEEFAGDAYGKPEAEYRRMIGPFR
jgi:CRP-like cAMP-binding protein